MLEEWRVGERRRGDHLTAGRSLSSGGVGTVKIQRSPMFLKERGSGQSRATASQWTHGALRRGASHWMRTGLIRHGMLVTTTIRWGVAEVGVVALAGIEGPEKGGREYGSR